MIPTALQISFFFFNDTATTEIYTLSLHDALPIFAVVDEQHRFGVAQRLALRTKGEESHQLMMSATPDRKSTRLNSSHQIISYAVFCLKKKNTIPTSHRRPGELS